MSLGRAGTVNGLIHPNAEAVDRALAEGEPKRLVDGHTAAERQTLEGDVGRLIDGDRAGDGGPREADDDDAGVRGGDGEPADRAGDDDGVAGLKDVGVKDG